MLFPSPTHILPVGKLGTSLARIIDDTVIDPALPIATLPIRPKFCIALPAPVGFIQVKTGCTGDEAPYKGEVLDEKYSNDEIDFITKVLGPENINFEVNSRDLTEKEQVEISEIIAYYKKTGKIKKVTQLKKKRKTKKELVK